MSNIWRTIPFDFLCSRTVFGVLGVLSVQEFKVGAVVVPNVFIHLAEPPDFRNVRVIVFSGRKKFIVAPIC